MTSPPNPPPPHDRRDARRRKLHLALGIVVGLVAPAFWLYSLFSYANRKHLLLVNLCFLGGLLACSLLSFALSRTTAFLAGLLIGAASLALLTGFGAALLCAHLFTSPWRVN